MKKPFLILLLLCAATYARAEGGGANGASVLPGSNEISPTTAVAVAVTPAAVAISSFGAAVRIDSALNTSIASALGNNGHRAKVQVQMSTDPVLVYWGYSSAVTVATGFKMPALPEILEFNLGKGVGIYAIGNGTTTIKVGGLGYK